MTPTSPKALKANRVDESMNWLAKLVASGEYAWCPANCSYGRFYLDNGPSGLTGECQECGGEGVVPVEDDSDD